MKEFIEKFKIDCKGVIHIGAHFGGEITTYNELKFKNIIFVEPIQKTFNKLAEVVTEKNSDTECNVELWNKALGNKIGVVEMYVEEVNLGQSSSILKPEFHLYQYPGIVFPYRETVEISTLNNELKNNSREYNVMNIDVQGYELEVLKGSTDILDKIDIINTEVNKVHMYENCPLIQEIDSFLSSYDFVKVHEDWMGEVWGDAIYVKRIFLD
jgi:FkbM family methyltransferase